MNQDELKNGFCADYKCENINNQADCTDNKECECEEKSDKNSQNDEFIKFYDFCKVFLIDEFKFLSIPLFAKDILKDF